MAVETRCVVCFRTCAWGGDPPRMTEVIAEGGARRAHKPASVLRGLLKAQIAGAVPVGRCTVCGAPEVAPRGTLPVRPVDAALGARQFVVGDDVREGGAAVDAAGLLPAVEQSMLPTFRERWIESAGMIPFFVFLIPISFLWLWGASFLLTFFYNALMSPVPVDAAVGGPVTLPGWPGAENGPGVPPGMPGSPGHRDEAPYQPIPNAPVPGARRLDDGSGAGGGAGSGSGAGAGSAP